RQGLEGQRGDEGRGPLGEHHPHHGAQLPQAADGEGRLVGGDAAGDAKQYAALVQRPFPLGLIPRHLAQPPPSLSCSRLYGSSGPSHSNLSCRSSSKAMLTGLAMAVATRVLVPPASTIWRARRAATTTKVYLLSAFSSR